MTTIPEGWKWAHWESGTIGSVKRVPCGIAHSSIKNQYFGSRDLRDTPSRWVITN
jgi:hypothetical protein